MNQDRTRDEEILYSKCRNELIEIEIGAKDGLRLIREAMDQITQTTSQAKKMNNS